MVLLLGLLAVCVLAHVATETEYMEDPYVMGKFVRTKKVKFRWRKLTKPPLPMKNDPQHATEEPSEEPTTTQGGFSFFVCLFVFFFLPFFLVCLSNPGKQK